MYFTLRANTTKQPLGSGVMASAKDGVTVHISDLLAENTVLKNYDTKQDCAKKSFIFYSVFQKCVIINKPFGIDKGELERCWSLLDPLVLLEEINVHKIGKKSRSRHSEGCKS